MNISGKRTFTVIALIFILLSVFLIESCTEDPICTQSTRSLVRIGFYQRVNGLEKDTSFSGFSVKGIVDSDSFLYENANEVSMLSLPLSTTQNSSFFVLTFEIPDTTYEQDTVKVPGSISLRFIPDTTIVADTFYIHYTAVPDTIWVDSLFKVPVPFTFPLSDTIQFNHTGELVKISQACGFTMEFSVTDIFFTRNVIKAAVVFNREVIPEFTTNEDAEPNIKIYF